MKRLGWPVQPRLAGPARFARTRRIVRDARAAGYQWGECPLTSAVAVGRPTLDEIIRRGDFDDPDLFRGARLVDDPVLGLLVRAAGYRSLGYAADGEIFGLQWRGLPDTPQRLLDRGYSIIHSVKNDPHFTEDEIRAFFAAKRPAP
jgi:hypothetical protein